MQEVCFCGRIGHPLDRQLIYIEQADGGLLSAACPQCGRIDNLDWLHPSDRLAMVRRATAGMLHAIQSGHGAAVLQPSHATRALAPR
jgi:hypothetical protein